MVPTGFVCYVWLTFCFIVLYCVILPDVYVIVHHVTGCEFPWLFLLCFGKINFGSLTLLCWWLWTMVLGSHKSLPLVLLVHKCPPIAQMPFWFALTSIPLRIWWSYICASSSVWWVCWSMLPIWYRNIPCGCCCWVWLLHHASMPLSSCSTTTVPSPIKTGSFWVSLPLSYFLCLY